MKKWSKLFHYNDFVITLYERVLSEDDLNKYAGYFDNVDDINTQEEIKKEIYQIRDLIKELDYNDIHISKLRKDRDDESYCKPSYNDIINYKISTINNLIQKITDEDIKEELIELYDGFRPSIYLETDNFNRIHIPIGIPDEMKGIGLGYNIYKAVLKKHHFISSDSETVVSRQSKNIWNKLRKDNEIYTNLCESKILSFHQECPDNILEKTLEKFYHDKLLLKDKNNILIDPTLVSNKPNIVAFLENIL